MEAVFGLIEDLIGVRFENFIRDFFTAVCGEAMEDDSVGLCYVEYGIINREGSKVDFTFLDFGFLTHTVPNVCIDNVGILSRFKLIVCNCKQTCFVAESYNLVTRVVSLRAYRGALS